MTIQSAAQTPIQSERAKCQQALDDSDAVIKKQGEVMILLARQNEELKSEDEKLTEALVSLRNTSNNGLQREILTGVGGALLGVLLVTWIKK